MGKLTLILLLSFLGIPICAQSFSKEKLRVDIEIKGSANSCNIQFLSIVKEPIYSGSSQNYFDKFGYGDFACELIDHNSSKVIYSNGFSSLFNEWQLTNPTSKAPYSIGKTLCLPYPTNTSFLKIYQIKEEIKTVIDSIIINPIEIKSSNNTQALTPKKIYNRGNSEKKLDILIMGDGFAQCDISMFNDIARAFSDSLLAVSPFSKHRNNINFWSICPSALKSGIEYKSGNSPLGCQYNTLDSDRYLYTLKNQIIANIAAITPYDHIIILVNSSKYGGGGIYNDFAVAAAGGDKNIEVMIHEFGHSFAGLGDEYSYDAPSKNIKKTKEPWEPNLTYLIDFESKWKNFISQNTPIPTPDSLALIFKVGAYEGAGYQTKGIYRPSYDCRMRTTNVNYFCDICKRIIDEKIKSYAHYEEK